MLFTSQLHSHRPILASLRFLLTHRKSLKEGALKYPNIVATCQSVKQPMSAQFQTSTLYLAPAINRTAKNKHAKYGRLPPKNRKKMKNDGNSYRLLSDIALTCLKIDIAKNSYNLEINTNSAIELLVLQGF